MSNEVGKNDKYHVIVKIASEAMKVAYVVYDKIIKAKTEIIKEQKEIYLSAIDCKKAEINSLCDMYKDKDLSNSQMEKYRVEVREITNSIIEINNEYDKKLQKREENQNKILRQVIDNLTKLGVTGIIVYGVTFVAKTVKK